MSDSAKYLRDYEEPPDVTKCHAAVAHLRELTGWRHKPFQFDTCLDPAGRGMMQLRSYGLLISWTISGDREMLDIHIRGIEAELERLESLGVVPGMKADDILTLF